MMEMVIRLADTGHSQQIKIDQHSTGEMLINQVAKIYKIHPSDQLLLIKSGQQLFSQHSLIKVLWQQNSQKTYGQLPSNNSNQKLPCIYVYNLKQLRKFDEKDQKKSNQMLKQQLLQQMQATNHLKTTFNRYASIKDIHSAIHLEKYQKMVYKIQSLRQDYKVLQKYCQDIKECYMKTEEVIQRCSNQKKSMLTLCKWLNIDIKQLQSNHKNIFNLKEDIKKFTIDDKSLRQKSSFFEQKKSKVWAYEQKVNEYKLKVECWFKKIKQNMKRWKSIFKEVDQKCVRADTQYKIKKCQQRNMANKSSYDQILAEFSNLIKIGQSKYLDNNIISLQKISHQLVKQYSQLYQESINSYVLFMKYNQRGEHQFKDIFMECSKNKADIRQMNQTYHQIEKGLMQIIQGEKNGESVQLIQKDPFEQIINLQDQYQEAKFRKSLQQHHQHVNSADDLRYLTQRNRFNELFRIINQYIRQLNIQEKQQQYYSGYSELVPLLQQAALVNSKLQNMLMANAQQRDNVISLDQSEHLVHFVILNYSIILESINSMWSEQKQKKVNNLQQILQRMAEIFTKVYDKKMSKLTDQMNKIRQQLTEQRIYSQSLALKLAEGSANSQHLSLLESISYLQKQIYDLRNNLTNRERQITAQQRELNHERGKINKLREDYKQLQNNLFRQTAINEQLFSQIEKNIDEIKELTQINNQLQLYIDQQPPITQSRSHSPIQTQLTNSSSHTSNNILQNNQDSLIFKVHQKFSQNSSKQQPILNDITQKNMHNQQQKQVFELREEILRLKEEMKYLQIKNQRFQIENNELIVQMDKIIRRHTIDIETQTSLGQNNKNGSEISIQDNVQVGQLAIFMPFNHSTYVAATQHDHHRTIPSLHDPQIYMLDISAYDNKTRQTLRQCSFVVVVQVRDVRFEGRGWMVTGKIKFLLGFEDESPILKNYSHLL